MIRLSKRDIDIEKIAEGLKFVSAIKKPLKYKIHKGEDVDTMRAFTYMKSPKKQTIDTMTSDGKETTNIAQNGDIIFSGPTKEKYVLKTSKVKKMYDGKIGGVLTPQKEPKQVALYKGDEINFKASWGEDTVLKSGDYLVKEPDGSGYYRIAKKEFKQTYEVDDV